MKVESSGSKQDWVSALVYKTDSISEAIYQLRLSWFDDNGKEHMLDTDTIFGLDYETFGTRDLPQVGLRNYLKDEDFQPLLACIWYDGVAGVYDFVKNPGDREEFKKMLAGAGLIYAHNSMFEEAVSVRAGFINPERPDLHRLFVDTAVLASAAGASRHLAGAAPQLLNIDKMEEGNNLINIFSKPTARFNFKAPTWAGIVAAGLEKEWDTFIQYCIRDAELSFKLAQSIHLPECEEEANMVTEHMNRVGWTVDLDSLHQMQKLYEKNLAQLLSTFQARYDPDQKLNLNSLKQLKEWCMERGVRATSFDEKHVEKMRKQISKRLIGTALPADKARKLYAVYDMLTTKQALGGSALKKLAVIEAMSDSESGKLPDQYLHIGASQSFRTTGRGVQMQNLPRLALVRDMKNLFIAPNTWTNEELAGNIRQLFTSAHPEGKLIVGDFSSVESRGLAWIAGEQWKLDAYYAGKDLYKVLAASPDMFDKPYDSITKEERQSGKVGELSCGYGAGAAAVARFAEGMGIEMSEENAQHIVTSWRGSNPAITTLWRKLDEALADLARSGNVGRITLPYCDIRVGLQHAPESLLALHQGVKSLFVQVFLDNGKELRENVLTRVFHGFHQRGRDFCYYKPSELKSGDLWKNWYRDPKTGKIEHYKLYGGKLTGIITQSFCRELFFSRAVALHDQLSQIDNVTLIGQFHDELVMDWTPPKETDQNAIQDVNDAVDLMAQCMSDPVLQGSVLHGFPLDAEVHYDYRYIK